MAFPPSLPPSQPNDRNADIRVMFWCRKAWHPLPPTYPSSSPFHDPVTSSLPVNFQPWPSSIIHCRGTAEDSRAHSGDSEPNPAAGFTQSCACASAPPLAHRDTLHHLHQPMVRASACSEVPHFTPQALPEQGAHHEAPTSACNKTLQPGEQQFAPNIPKRSSWDHGAPGRMMKCKALPSAHINHLGLVPVLFKASLFSNLWQISILC